MIEFKLKPTFATVDSCFDLVRSHQYGIARYKVFSWSTDIHTLTKMVMTSDETQIQILANWPMSHAKRVTRDNWKNPEYHVIAALRNLRTDTICPAGSTLLAQPLDFARPMILAIMTSRANRSVRSQWSPKYDTRKVFHSMIAQRI